MPLLKRVVGGMGLNTACWKPGRTYTNTPIAGLIVQIFLQPGGSDTLGYTISWAAENALNVAVRLVITCVMPVTGLMSVSMNVDPGVITTTQTWTVSTEATNFQLGAQTLG